MESRTRTRRTPRPLYDGDTEIIISTGSTLLDLAIAGTRIRGGGIPAGVAIEIFGDSSAGKTALMCEITANVQRRGGDALFNDPEARLDKEFAKLFNMDITEKTIKTPDTVAEVFEAFQNWKPVGEAPHIITADSIAALSTEGEMKDAKGYDGAKRANDFSVGFRTCCRILKKNNWIMLFSNQIRDSMNSMPFAKKTKATGGHAPKFYASVRLEISKIKVIKPERTVHGKKHKEAIGVYSVVDVIKNSVDKGYRSADIYIMNDYGIDDVRANLIYIKQNSKHGLFSVDGEEKLGSSIDEAIQAIEQRGLEKKLRRAVINLWEEIQAAFKQERTPKVRW